MFPGIVITGMHLDREHLSRINELDQQGKMCPETGV